jgi:hypothetical protein
MTVEIYLPDSAPGPEPAVRAPSPAALSGLRIAVLDNGKPNADVVMTALAEALAARTGASVSLVTKKGPQGLSANAAIPVADDRLALVCDEADVVITGAADCGSCTAYSVVDAITLERHGKPTVVTTTTNFRPVAETLSKSFGAPDTRLLVMPHPIGGTDADTLGRWAESSTDALISLFTGSTTVAGQV